MRFSKWCEEIRKWSEGKYGKHGRMIQKRLNRFRKEIKQLKKEKETILRDYFYDE